jgi:phosphatidylglycerophosphate synthase
MNRRTGIPPVESGGVPPAFDHAQASKAQPSAAMRLLGIVDNGLNRPVASLIARAAYHTPITPNGLSYLSGGLGLIAAWFFWRATYADVLVGAVLAQTASIVDGADGMLARARKACTPYGAHLDLVLDRIIDFFILSAVAAGVWTRTGNSTLGMLGLLMAGLYLLQIHLFYLTKSVLGVTATGDTGEARALLYWALVGFAAADRLDLFLWAMLAETTIVNVVRFAYFVRLGARLRG